MPCSTLTQISSATHSSCARQAMRAPNWTPRPISMSALRRWQTGVFTAYLALSAVLAGMHPVQQQAGMQAATARQLPAAKHSLQQGKVSLHNCHPGQQQRCLHQIESLMLMS